MSEITKSYYGFNIKEDSRGSDQIELESGFSYAQSPFGVNSEHNLFREVFWQGSDNDYLKVVEAMKGEFKSNLKFRLNYASFILSAQADWSDRDQVIFDLSFDVSNFEEIVISAIIRLQDLKHDDISRSVSMHKRFGKDYTNEYEDKDIVNFIKSNRGVENLFDLLYAKVMEVEYQKLWNRLELAVPKEHEKELENFTKYKNYSYEDLIKTDLIKKAIARKIEDKERMADAFRKRMEDFKKTKKTNPPTRRGRKVFVENKGE